MNEADKIELDNRPFSIVESVSIASDEVENLFKFLDKFKHPLVELHIKHCTPRTGDIIFVYIRFKCKRKDAMFLYCHKDIVSLALKEQFKTSKTWDTNG